MIDEIQRRFTEHPVRMESEGKIEGIAAVINSRTDLGYFYEEIAAGAFDDILQDDVRALFNHDSSKILARTKSGTLEVFISERGDLAYKYETPNISYAKDLAESIRLGDVDQSSFGFTIEGEEWRDMESEKPTRIITKLGRLMDVSPVTYPAYQDTTASARNEEFEAVKQAYTDKKDAEKRAEKIKNQESKPAEGKPIDLYKRKLSILKTKK